METLDQRYERLLKAGTDISEHMPILRALASGRVHVVELGVRYATSTTALLCGQPDQLTSIDLASCPQVDSVRPLAGRTRFRFIQGDSRLAVVAPMDFLFIDTEHTYDCCISELTRHGPNCHGVIALHDTETCPGLRKAIAEFCKSYPFTLAWHLTNSHGLSVLIRY